MRIIYYIPAVCFSLLLITCQSDNTGPLVKEEVPEVKQIKKKEDSILQVLDKKTGVQNKTIWHSPRILIQRLGNLSTKTVANIGAGPYGYFSFQIADKARKVIAIDIDPKAIHFMDSMRLLLLPPTLQENLETRLVEPDDPNLRFEEADVVTIMNTYAYLPNRIKYLKNLRNGIARGGEILIVDFKMRKLPIGPPQSEKVPLYQVELDLEEAGYQIKLVDDKSLEYQYMVLAVNP